MRRAANCRTGLSQERDVSNHILVVRNENSRHQLALFILPSNQKVTEVQLTLNTRAKPSTTMLPTSPEAYKFPWKAFDQQVAKFRPSPAVEVIVPEGPFENYEPYIREQMQSTQASGTLSVTIWNNDVREVLDKP